MTYPYKCQIILSLLTGKKVVFHYLYRFEEKEHPYVCKVIVCTKSAARLGIARYISHTITRLKVKAAVAAIFKNAANSRSEVFTIGYIVFCIYFFLFFRLQFIPKDLFLYKYDFYRIAPRLFFYFI